MTSVIRYKVRFNRIDNRAEVYVNGSQVYEKYYDYDPDLGWDREFVDITDQLNPHPYVNQIEVRCINYANHSNQHTPWNIRYKITKELPDGTSLDFVAPTGSSGSSGSRTTYSKVHPLVLHLDLTEENLSEENT